MPPEVHFLQHPALPFAAAALLVPLAGRAARALPLLAAAAAVGLLAALPAGAEISLGFLGEDRQLLRDGSLGRVFALAFAIFGGIAGLYGWGEDRRGPRAASLGLAAAGIGVALAGDFLWLLFFWEWLAVLSLVLIWSGGRRRSIAAGIRYLFLHLAGGACLLAGIILLAAGGVTAVGPIELGSAGSWLVLIGFLVNAAVPPLHAWLPDAYPEASPAGMVHLSAFTTKAAVCVLARVFPGAEVLVWAGAAMALYGVVFAVLENDIRRLLAYHIVSQVGYMVCGVGLGAALAIDGTAAHAFSHIFYKGLLLMATGAVIHATGRAKLTELGGIARAMPWTLILYTVGAFSISGVPLFNGFISKSMIVDAAAGSGRYAVELMLVVASMGTFLHTGLKLPWFTFFARPAGSPAAAPRAPVPASMVAAMALAAVVCIGTGIFPSLLYDLLPAEGAGYRPFTAPHVAGALQLLVATAAVFWAMRGMLGGEPTVTLDADRLYRRPAAALLAAALALRGASARAGSFLGAIAAGLLGAAEGRLARPGGGATLAAQVAGIIITAVAVVLILLAAR